MFKKIIRIPNKSFNDLNAEETALMIEADSSLTADGNESFASCALDEFLYAAELHRADLLALRKLILDNIYVDKAGTTRKEINSEFLRKLADKIRRGEILIASSV